MSCLSCAHNANENINVNTDRVCCNQKSPHYNEVVSREVAAATTCPLEISESDLERLSRSPYAAASGYFD